MFTNVLQILIIVDTANIFVKYSKYFSNVYKYIVWNIFTIYISFISAQWRFTTRGPRATRWRGCRWGLSTELICTVLYCTALYCAVLHLRMERIMRAMAKKRQIIIPAPVLYAGPITSRPATPNQVSTTFRGGFHNIRRRRLLLVNNQCTILSGRWNMVW